VRWAKITVEAYPVGKPLDQPAGTAAMGIPLIAVHQLVGQDAGDLRGEPRGWLDGVDVAEGEVDFFVIVV
jgi:hypothetical protein